MQCILIYNKKIISISSQTIIRRDVRCKKNHFIQINREKREEH